MCLVRLFTWLYARLLRLYPAAYRAEYGPELQSVFRLALQAAARQGWPAVVRLGLREIRDWPGAVWQAYRRERRRRMSANGFTEETPLLRRELLAAMIIFLLPLLMSLFSVFATTGLNLPHWLDYVTLVLVWGAVLFAASDTRLHRFSGRRLHHRLNTL